MELKQTYRADLRVNQLRQMVNELLGDFFDYEAVRSGKIAHFEWFMGPGPMGSRKAAKGRQSAQRNF